MSTLMIGNTAVADCILLQILYGEYLCMEKRCVVFFSQKIRITTKRL